MDYFPNESKIKFVNSANENESDYSPLHWENYFDQKKYVNCSSGKFCVYTSGVRGSLLILLHGAGHSALTWAVFTKALRDLIPVKIIAIDLRSHGDSTNVEGSQMDVETIAKDCIEVVQRLDESETPKYIIGHSFGGCVGVRMQPKMTNVLGLALIDVVESTAKVSLNVMRRILDSRPKYFNNINQAIKYINQSKITSNKESARVSGPGQMKLVNDNHEKITASVDLFYEVKSNPNKITWRTNLYDTSCYWSEWFEGLSKSFLSIKCPKLLVLANGDRLDKDLLVGQMSGLYQLEIIPKSGHCVQEDVPDKLAKIITNFIKRNGTITRTLKNNQIEQNTL